MKSRRRKFLPAIGGIVAGFLNGLFGSGGGTVIVPFLEEFLDQEEHTSHATAILIILFFTGVSLFFYGFRNQLPLNLGIQTAIGGVVGGFIGAKILKRLSGNVIRKIFGGFMILAAVRMVVG